MEIIRRTSQPRSRTTPRVPALSPKDTYLVFTCGTGRTSSQAAKLAEELGFESTTFCPVNQWKEQGYQAEPMKK